MKSWWWWVATGNGVGHLPWASGTWGTLWAVILFLPLWQASGNLHIQLILGVVLVVLFIVGVRACDLLGKALGKADHRVIVCDEMVAMWLILVFAPHTLPINLNQMIAGAIGVDWGLSQSRGNDFWIVTMAFLGFRFFDIVKWYPANIFDRHWHNGWGVMLDDLMAAGHTLAVLWLMFGLLSMV